MKTRKWWGVVLAPAALIACQTTQDRTPVHVLAAACPGPGCNIDVTVTPTDTTCTVSVSVDEVTVKKKKNPILIWELQPTSDGKTYRFAAQGIAFKTLTPITNADFDSGMAVGKDKFMWHSVNANGPDPRTFEYAVRVQRVEGGTTTDCDVLDPKIVNGGD